MTEHRFILPDDVRLIGLEQAKRGWIAYTKFQAKPYGPIGHGLAVTPAEAVTLACASLRDRAQSYREEPTPPVGLNLKLNLDRLRRPT